MKVHLSYTQPQLDIFYGDVKPFNIITKGRRFGLTKGMANMTIESLLDGKSVLWGDTVHGNIERYFDRYFKPELKDNNIPYHWDRQSKILKIYNGHCDFRSADKPENWEGFGYDLILLNEAGIILKNRYLYTNAVLPMLLDNPDSVLFAGGVPKGKKTKDGSEHPFYTLYNRGKDSDKYRVLEYTSYDNPLLSPEDVSQLEDEINIMSPDEVDQEIYGQFKETDAKNPFIHNYSKDKHEAVVEYDPRKIVYASMDFNINPYGIIFGHNWRDADGFHTHIFKAVTVKEATIDKMVKTIRDICNPAMLKITGDASGNNGRIGKSNNNSFFKDIQLGLGLNSNQVIVPKTNPTQKKSREQCNTAFHYHEDIKFDSVNCEDLITDFKIVQCDSYGAIIKRNRKDISQRAELLDCWRYYENTFLKEWRIKNKP